MNTTPNAMNYKLLVLDLDGTLTNTKKEITPYTLRILIEAQQKGLKIALASGRPTYGIFPLAEKLRLKEYGGYVLAYNGGKIIDCSTNNILHEQALDADLVPWLHQLSKESDTVILTYDGEYIVTENPEDEYVVHEAFLNKMPTKKIDNFTEYVTYAPDKCLIVGHPEKLIPLVHHINEKASERMSAFRSEPFFLELVPKGIDKAQSLKRLLAIIGHTREEMIAVGDGFNDLSMIEYAGLGVAMSNAQAVVKEAANYITLSNEEDGVAHLVEKLFAGQLE